MSEQQATPRPWRVMDDDSEFTGQYDVWIAGGDEDDGLIVGAAWQDDAALIVRAVNAYDAMRVALVNAAVPLEGLLLARQSVQLCDGSWAEIENAVAHIRAALQAAKGPEA